VPQWEVYEWTVEQIGEVLNGPIEKDNHHVAALGNTLSDTGNISPKAVARLSWGITYYSHVAKVRIIFHFSLFIIHFFLYLCIASIKKRRKLWQYNRRELFGWIG
jgi:hypothetical protein